VSLARLHRFAGADSRCALHARAFADRPKLAVPGVFHSVEPAWNYRNLRELAGHVRSPLFFARIRAAIGSAVQQTNCHPFRHGRWLFMHNGFISDFAAIKRDLALATDGSLYPEINGQTDTEVLFYLALTFGLEEDPPEAVARAIGLVELSGERRGIKYPFQGTIATSDDDRVWAFRYSTERNGPPCRPLVLDLEGVDFVDSPGAAKLSELHLLTQADRVTLRLARVKPPALKVLRADGIAKLIGSDRIYGNLDRAIEAQLGGGENSGRPPGGDAAGAVS
jgi:anti-anti-sigma regulatory factor